MELDDTLWQTPLKPGKWNIGETLAHLIAWDEFLLDHRLREIGSAESMSPAPEVDAFNHEAVTRMEKASKAELFRQFTETKLRIIEEIKELNAEGRGFIRFGSEFGRALNVNFDDRWYKED